MKSETQKSTLFRPLKKVSTMAIVAVALFASAAQADLAPTATGAEAEKIFNSIAGAPIVVKETKEYIMLFKNDHARRMDCTQIINLADKKGNVKKTECTEHTEASVAK